MGVVGVKVGFWIGGRWKFVCSRVGPVVSYVPESFSGCFVPDGFTRR